MINEISNQDDIIDVRDVIALVEELREKCDDLQSAIDDADAELDGTLENADAKQSAIDASADWANDYAEELETLESFLDECKGYGGDEQWEGDWYPVTAIHESYFEEAMDEMVADCYDMPKDLPSFMTITLDYVALQMDYTGVEFDGVTYYVR